MLWNVRLASCKTVKRPVVLVGTQFGDVTSEPNVLHCIGHIGFISELKSLIPLEHGSWNCAIVENKGDIAFRALFIKLATDVLIDPLG